MGYYQLPGSSNYINPLAGTDLTGGVKTGLGRAGKDARKMLDAFRRGEDISKFLGADIGAVNAAAAANNRMIQKRVGGNLAFQPSAVKAAVTEDALRDSEQDRQRSIAESVRGLRSEASNTLNSAFQAKRQADLEAARIRLEQLKAAAEAYNNSFRKKDPGLLGTILGGALGVGAAFAGRK